MTKNINIEIQKIFNLALENYEKKNFKVALNLYREIIKINPNHAESYYNLGLIFHSLKKLEKAKDYYQKAIYIKPNYLSAHNNIGLILKELDDLKDSKNAFLKALEIDPNCIEAIFNLGIVYRELGDFEHSAKCYKKVIKIKPNFIVAHNRLGNVYKKKGEYHKAVEHFKIALKLNPSSIEAQVNISNIYISQLDNFESGISASHEALRMHHDKSQFNYQSIPLHRLKHDVEQAKYLFSENFKLKGINEFIKLGNAILKRKENNSAKNNFSKKIFINKDEETTLLPFYKSNYVYKTSHISNGCINPNKNWESVEEEYFNSKKQIIYIDNFLSDQAARELQKFCLKSKIWIEEKQNSYLGSFSDKGFISTLHLQIALELKNKLPRLFGKHRLGRFWAFKYDTSLGKGINVHADFALINLNFWITPDEYNNDKSGGGLKVYDIAAPQDWSFRKYNTNAKEIYKFLKSKKANCINIPYKFNRAVLFNSDYFHETDKINFKDEYKARRINITYLFGDRLMKRK